MRRYRISYFIAEGFKGMFRNGIMSWASVFTLMSSLLMMGSFILLIQNINFNLNQVDEFNEIIVYVKTDADEAKINEISDKIKALPQVSNITFISKEEALEAEKARYGEEYAHIFDDYGNSRQNPLPDSFKIEYKDVKDVDVLVYNLKEIDGIDKVRNRQDITENIQKIKSVVTIVFSWLTIMLFMVTLFVIINTIKITVKAREEEIEIMRYIGATNFFITIPFVIEGIIIGLIASGLAYLIEWYIYSYVANEIISDYGGLVSAVSFDSMRIVLAVGFVTVGLFFSVIASSISMRKYMKA